LANLKELDFMIKNRPNLIRKNKILIFLAGATALILFLFFLIQQFTSEVNWNLFDFIIASGFLFGAGLASTFSYIIYCLRATIFLIVELS